MGYVGNRGLLVWKGKESDQRIFFSVGHPNGGFDVQNQVSYFASNRGIAAVVVPGSHEILAAWRGADDDNRIWTAQAYFDASSWSDQHNPSGVPRTEDRPALTVFNDKVVMAWRGAENDEHIWFSELGDHGWTAQQVTANGLASSTHGPALAVLSGRLFMAWKGSGDNQNLYWATYDGSTWADPEAFPGGSTHGPALVENNGALMMAWKGSGNDDHLWRASFRDRWSAQELAVGGSSHGPALGVIGNSVVMVWKGIVGDPRLWWSHNFRPQEEVANGAFGTSDTPALVSIQYADL